MTAMAVRAKKALPSVLYERMLVLNFKNVEGLVLENPDARKVLTGLEPTVNEWRLSIVTPGLAPTRRRAALRLLRSLTPDHLSSLSTVLRHDEVSVDRRLDPEVVSNLTFALEEAEAGLSGVDPVGQIAAYTDGVNLHICCWK